MSFVEFLEAIARIAEKISLQKIATVNYQTSLLLY